MKNTLILGMFALMVLSACRQDYSQLAQFDKEGAATPVTVQDIPVTETALPLRAVGLVSGSSEMKHAFKIGGIIHRIYVEEGQRFRAGQVLAELEMSEIDAQVAKARQGVTKMERDQLRVKSLYEDTVATLEQLQDIGTGLDVARADLEIAVYNQRYARIVARTGGKVLQRFAEEGELISPGMPVFRVSHEGGGGMYVLKVGLSDKDVVQLRPGDSSQVRFDAFPEQVFSAEVGAIAPQADPMTGSFEVELNLETNGYPLRHGFVGKAVIFPSADRRYYKVPVDAVVEADETEGRIFLADPETQTAQSTTIPLSRIGEDFVLVDTSLVRLDKPVVMAGAAYLVANQKISIQ